ncbi:MAG: hypothetical protein B7X84_08025 [Alphaproteobacteria bacterium 17-39-52]|nr:MAG: hypothetical protein B7X84_08025 [Alphaproteobacteria bacterium 17-39-52]
MWCTKYRYRALTGEIVNRVREITREICTGNYV